MRKSTLLSSITVCLLSFQVFSQVSTGEIKDWIATAQSTKELVSKRKLADKIRVESIKSDFPSGQFSALTMLAKCDYEEGDFPSSIKNCSRALMIVSENKKLNLNPKETHIIMSLALNKIGAFSDAVEHQKKALFWQAKQGKAQGVNQQFYMISDIGTTYISLEKYDSSIVYYNKALKIATDRNNNKLIGNSHNNIGLVYFDMGKPAQAKLQFEKALRFYELKEEKNNVDSFMISLIKGNLATCLDNNSPLKETYFLADIEGSKQYGDYENLLHTYIDYANYLIEMRQFAKAEKILSEAEYCAIHQLKRKSERQLSVYQSFTKLYLLSNQTNLAQKYFQKQLEHSEKTNSKKSRQELLEVHSSYKLNQIESELLIEKINGQNKKAQIDALNKENALSNFKLRTSIIVISLLIALFAVIALFIRMRNNKRNGEKALKEQLLQAELKLKSERLNKSALGHTRKQEFASKLIKKIASIKATEVEEKNELKLFVLNELDVLNTITKTDKDIAEIGEEFFTRLKMKFPDLTDSDIQLLGYIKMNLTNKQIGEYKNIAPSSVKMSKNRLRKKLDLPVGSDFSEVLNG